MLRVLSARVCTDRAAPLILVGCILATILLVQPRLPQLHAIDWAVLLVLIQEGASLFSSRYTASGVLSAKVVMISGLFTS